MWSPNVQNMVIVMALVLWWLRASSAGAWRTVVTPTFSLLGGLFALLVGLTSLASPTPRVLQKTGSLFDFH